MPKYTIELPEVASVIYRVQATTFEQAVEFALAGENLLEEPELVPPVVLDLTGENAKLISTTLLDLTRYKLIRRQMFAPRPRSIL